MTASLFEQKKPLAERMRPKNLDQYIGQEHVLELVKKMTDSGNLPSMILWGPAGVGKTTLAQLLCTQTKRSFFALSAINVGVKEVREVIEKASYQQGTVLFIDEIHRFNKSQQDALLGAVEKGIIVLIGATTENPSFEINSALLSRCQTYILKPLENVHIEKIIRRALKEDEYLKEKPYRLAQTDILYQLSNGDARKALNILETAVALLEEKQIEITPELIEKATQQIVLNYDKDGEQHYDIISAFIKSIRGSDPNAAIYYLARMVEAGEDPKFIARRMLILASEDIGNANPTALVLATACFQAVSFIGFPEARITLAQTVAYLAASPKSNASYTAIEKGLEIVRKTGDQPVPLHLRNAPTKLMKDVGYGENYQYAHDFEGNFIDQEFMPDKLRGQKIYDPLSTGREGELRSYLRRCWKEKYGY